MKNSLFAILILFFITSTQAQDKNLSLRFNFGSTFSKPTGDIGAVATKGKSLQPSVSAEAGYHLNFSKKSIFGIKVAGTAGYDMANFLSNDRITELKVSVPNLKARIYPFSVGQHFDEALEKLLPIGLPLLVEIPVWLGIYAGLNSLHFDYGVGFGKILETDYAETGFQDVTVNRTMKYVGWGVQPQIYHSESGRWTMNAVFDFGKYSWTNANGGTSSFRSNQVGFGFQYNF